MPSPAKTTPPQQQQVLEINLISAQGLKPPASPRRRLQTYALTWIHSDTKLRTRVDKVGGENPTWNDKFLFRVTPEFLASETSGVCVAIYAVGTFRDHLIGTVRFLISNILSSSSDTFSDASSAVAELVAGTTPCFSAVQIRRPSGRFHGVMNIGAMVIEGSEFPALAKNKISAIGYRDLMGQKIQQNRRKTDTEKPKKSAIATAIADEVVAVASSESCENSFTDSTEGVESTSTTTSSTSSPRTTTTAATALKEWNGVRELAGNKGLTASGFLCCLVAHRSGPLSPTNTTVER